MRIHTSSTARSAGLQQAIKRFPKAAEFCTNAWADGHHPASNNWGQPSPESPRSSSHCISLQEKAKAQSWQCVQVTLTRGVNVSTAAVLLTGPHSPQGGRAVTRVTDREAEAERGEVTPAPGLQRASARARVAMPEFLAPWPTLSPCQPLQSPLHAPTANKMGQYFLLGNKPRA